MSDTILEHVKGYVNLAFAGDDSFDTELKLSLSSYIAVTRQLVDLNNVEITEDTTFEDLMVSPNKGLLDMVKHYICLRVRLDFDPPVGSILSMLEKAKTELEHRLIIEGGMGNDHR